MKLKTAIVTGATSGIGYEITKKLISENKFFVIGIGRNFEKKEFDIFDANRLLKLKLDLNDGKKIESEIKNILKNHKDFKIELLINNAGIGDFKPLEDFSVSQIDEVINVNLKAPLILSSVLLRELRDNQGTIININSIEAIRYNKFSAIYTATKSGLRAFGLSLFEEVRKNGVKVVNINPDITETDFFENLTFQPAKSQEAKLDPVVIADLVQTILNLPQNTVINELTVRPQKFQIEKKQIKK